jgi:hypothetical protein
MKFLILLFIILMLTFYKYTIGDSTNKKGYSKIEIIDSAKSNNNNSYHRILLDSNSILRINEINEKSFWSLNNLLPIGISVFSISISIIALVITKKKFKREHIISLFNYWEAVNEINPTNPIYVDVRNAVNALTLTSIIWSYKIIDRRIIYSSHWDAFKILYEILINCNKAPNGSYKPCSTYITKDITITYNEMLKFKKI